jgi:putative membrane protein (TIGR04086 family)
MLITSIVCTEVFYMHKTSSKSKKRRGVQPMRREPIADASPALLPKHLLKSFAMTLGVGLLLIVSASLIAYFMPDPNALIMPLGLAAAGLTAFLGGVIAVRIHGGGALLSGLLNGYLLMIVMLLLSLCFVRNSSGYTAGVSCLLHAGFLLLSVAGAYLGNRRKTRKKR